MKAKNRVGILYLLLIILSVYVYFDLKSSSIVGNSNSNRVMVYILLAAMMLVYALYFVCTIVQIDAVEISLLVIFLWITINNILNLNFVWMTYIHIGLSFLWLCVYHFYSRSLDNNERALHVCKRYFYILVFVFIIATLYANNIRKASVHQTGNALNTAYYVLVFLPFVLSAKNKIYKYITMIVIIFTVLLSLKRGAVIGMMLMFIAYWLYSRSNIKSRKFQNLGTIIAITIIVSIGFYTVNIYTGGTISERFSLDALFEGSGRINIYRNALNVISNRNILLLFFGSGAGSTVKLLGTVAHNEWFEFTICYGLVGNIIYLSLIIRLIQKARLMKRINHENAKYIMSLVVCFIVTGIFEPLYFVQYTLYIFTFIGILTSNHTQQRLEVLK